MASTNGHRVQDLPLDRPAPLPVLVATPPASPELHHLLLELQESIEELPVRISKAASDAMRRQHDTNRKDLANLWNQIAAEADQVADHIKETQIRKPESQSQDPITQAFDERFQWLVNELSERFVLFGNELARIEKRLAAGTNGTGARDGYSEPDRDFRR